MPRGREFPKCPVWDQFGDGAVVIDQLIRITRSGEGKEDVVNQKGGLNAGQAKTSLSCDRESLAQVLEHSKNSIVLDMIIIRV